MLNYANLNDVEFEYLCKDIMQSKLNVSLRVFAPGKDGGIDLTDDVIEKNIIIQVKHYTQSSISTLITQLKKEKEKVEKINPKQYYIFCSKKLTPQNIQKLYNYFSDYMCSSKNIVTLNEIEEFLTDPTNIEILKKHYKLWLDSIGVLENLLQSDLFVDCEVLLSDIEKEKKFFVQTKVFDEAIKCLDKNKALFITGNPGVGKTITSKMIVLYYASMGYQVRYTSSNTDFKELKRSLSNNPMSKQIILIDDCFGQAYFQMKDSQNDELLALIKYINLSPNKLLVLNSRITIFQEAKERKPELIKSLRNGEYKTFLIDMNAMSHLEKAKILYNHLFFNNIGFEYFEQIKKEKRYHTIIKHPNYNPRLIEYICDLNRLNDIAPKDYFNFILKQLNNPKSIWKDEYERRLSKSDRILLTSLYSISDKTVDETLLKDCFETRIVLEQDVDNTINQYEASLIRLSDGFIKIVDEKGKKKISVVNPSINDFLDARMHEITYEKENIVRTAKSIQQIYRMKTKEEFIRWCVETIQNGTIDQYIFETEAQKTTLVFYSIVKGKMQSKQLSKYVQDFLSSPHNLFINGHYVEQLIDIIDEFVDFGGFDYYGASEFLLIENNIHNFLSRLELDEILGIVDTIDSKFNGENRIRYVQCVTSEIQDALATYCDFYLDASDFDLDLSSIMEQAYCKEEQCVDEDLAIEYIEEDIKNIILEEITEKISSLPKDIVINKDFIDSLSINVGGAESMVTSYLKAEEYDMDDFYRETDHSLEYDEIDYIFNRE